MATRYMRTRPEWLDALQSGRKTVDARLLIDELDGLRVGDLVQYPGARARVRHLRFYPGFGDLLAFEDWRRIATGAPDREAVRTLLEEGDTATVLRTGAVAIELEPAVDGWMESSLEPAPNTGAGGPTLTRIVTSHQDHEVLLDHPRDAEIEPPK
jgi:ASC-1-like (ASCH) protein